MRKLLFLIIALAAVSRAQTHTYPALDTNNTFTGTNTFNNITATTGQFTVLNGIVNTATFSGIDMCAKINTAMLANPGSILDGRQFTGTQQCASNPFAGQTAEVVLYLGKVLIQTTVPWVTSSVSNALIYGNGRGSNGRGSTIQAVTGFPSTCDGLSIGCPVLRLGDGSQPAFGHRIENMAIDCNGQGGGIGLYSNDMEEQSGAWHFTILNCPVKGIYMDGTGSPGQGAENYVLEDGEVYSQTFGTSSTVNVHLISNTMATNGPKSVKDITSNGAPSHVILSSFTLQGISSGKLESLNAESATTGYTLSPNGSNATQSVHLDNVQCNLVITNCIWLQAPLNDITITNVMNNPGPGSPVTINDATSGLAYSDFSIAKYVVANAQNYRLNSATGGLQLVKNLNATGFNTSNQADSLYQVDFDSGKTADQGVALLLSDRGINKWNMAFVAPGNQYQIFDYVGNISRLRFNVAGATALQSTGTGNVQVNSDTGSGTGGFQVCSGGGSPTCLFQVAASGAVIAGTINASSVTLTGGGTTPVVGSPTVGQAACIKSAGPPVVIGFCSTVVSAGGACTCN